MLEKIISNLNSELGMVESMAVLYFIKRLIFLEYNTDKQKKLIHYLFTAVLILVIPSFFLETLFEGSAAYFIVGGIEFIYCIIICIIIIFSSYTGRKKRKLLGLFSIIPTLGYDNIITALYRIPQRHLNCTQLQSDLIELSVITLFFIVVICLTWEKTKPDFMKKLELDLEHRSLSVLEESGVWIIGTWLCIIAEFSSANIFPDSLAFFEELPPALLSYIDITNSIIGIIITALIINGSYRKYYYEKNMNLQRSLINTMANLVESRDLNTGGHIHRTAKYVEIIARKLQKEGKFQPLLTDEYIEDMIIAAPLHDVGKIHISDMILNKPDKLNDEEFKTMKSHSAAGGEIISRVEDEVGDVSYLTIAKDMAEFHHERMDGKGYPHGLSGDDIPVCARILAVADVFDALSAKRCYKEAMPLDKAFAIIKEEAGTHFDVEIAEAFLDSREEIEKYLGQVRS